MKGDSKMNFGKKHVALSVVALLLLAGIAVGDAIHRGTFFADEIGAKSWRGFDNAWKLVFPSLTADDTAVGARATQTLGNKTFDTDLTVLDQADGGDNSNQNIIKGKLGMTVVAMAAGTNGAAAGKTVVLMDDSPAGEFSATDADVACTTSATYVKAGSNSLKMAVTTAADAGDGCHDPVTLDFSADEFVGFWIRSSVALAAGDVILDLTDDGGARQTNIPALNANQWTWVNIGLPALDADKNTITDISIELSAAGATKAAAGAFDVYVDAMYKWDDTEEEELGNSICLDCVYGVLAVATSAASANTLSNLAMYTDYFIKYTASNEKVVWITDQSANSTVAFIGYTGG
jgi:hypothetical protein